MASPGRSEQRVHVRPADGRAPETYRFEREEDAQRAQRHDERRHLQPGDEQAVEEAAGGAEGEADEQRQGPGDAEVGVELGHDDRGEDGDGPDGEVDAGGQDDDRLADGERPHDGDLLDDQGQVERPQEAVGRDQAEGDTTMATRTMNGPSAGYLWRVRWMRSSAVGAPPLLLVDRAGDRGGRGLHLR